MVSSAGALRQRARSAGLESKTASLVLHRAVIHAGKPQPTQGLPTSASSSCGSAGWQSRRDSRSARRMAHSLSTRRKNSATFRRGRYRAYPGSEGVKAQELKDDKMSRADRHVVKKQCRALAGCSRDARAAALSAGSHRCTRAAVPSSNLRCVPTRRCRCRLLRLLLSAAGSGGRCGRRFMAQVQRQLALCTVGVTSRRRLAAAAICHVIIC